MYISVEAVGNRYIKAYSSYDWNIQIMCSKYYETFKFDIKNPKIETVVVHMFKRA